MASTTAKKQAPKRKAREPEAMAGSPPAGAPATPTWIHHSLSSLVVPVSSLRLDPENARLHGAKNLATIKASLGRFGQMLPLVAHSDGLVIIGNGRLQTILENDLPVSPGGKTRARWDQVAVLRFDGTAAEARALGLVDNRAGELAEWNFEVLSSSMKLLSDDVDLVSLFDDLIPVCSLPADGEDAAQGGVLDGEAVAKAGDLWVLGDHRLMCGDSGNEGDVARLMDGKKARLMMTDPPYGVDYVNTKAGIPRPGFVAIDEHFADICGDGLKDVELQKFLEGVFRTAAKHLDCAAWYLWHAHLTAGFFSAAAAAAAAVILHRQIIWRKPGFVLTRSGMYHWQHEPCFYGWVRGKEPAWYGEKNQTSVWDVGRDKDRGMHPTQKPVELFRIAIRNHLRKGEVCYEPFAGSGSQVIAAETCGVRCFAMEIFPKYCDVIVARWERFTGKKAEVVGV